MTLVEKSDPHKLRLGQNVELVIKWRGARELKSENRFLKKTLLRNSLKIISQEEENIKIRFRDFRRFVRDIEYENFFINQ